MVKLPRFPEQGEQVDDLWASIRAAYKSLARKIRRDSVSRGTSSVAKSRGSDNDGTPDETMRRRSAFFADAKLRRDVRLDARQGPSARESKALADEGLGRHAAA